MKISIVTTVFNGEKYIEETLESVLTQRGNFELEYIVVDGKSTDSTLEIIQKYKKLVDESFYKNRNLGIRMTVISEEDNGLYDGLSKGFKICSGDIVAYINAGDFYFPNSFSCVNDVFNDNKNVKWIVGICTTYNEHGQNIFTTPYLFKNQNLIQKGAYGIYYNRHIQQESTFWRKDLLEKIDLNKLKDFKLAGDFYLWNTFAQYEPIYTVNSHLSGFRITPNQLSEDSKSYTAEMLKITNNAKLTPKEEKELAKIMSISENLPFSKLIEHNLIYFDTNIKKWIVGNSNPNDSKFKRIKKLKTILKMYTNYFI